MRWQFVVLGVLLGGLGACVVLGGLGSVVGNVMDLMAARIFPELLRGLPLPANSSIGRHASAIAGGCLGFLVGPVLGGIFGAGGRPMVKQLHRSLFQPKAPPKVPNGSGPPPMSGYLSTAAMASRVFLGVVVFFALVALGAICGACAGALAFIGMLRGLAQLSVDVDTASSAAPGASIGAVLGGCLGSIVDARFWARLMQSKLLYHPRKYNNAAPICVHYVSRAKTQYILQLVKYTLSSWSRVEQQGFLLRPKDEEVRALWFIFGGNAMVAHDWLQFCQHLIARDAGHGQAYVLMDYPGYGANDGQPSPSVVLQASLRLLRAAIVELGCKQPQVNFLGHSLGAAVAARLAANLARMDVVPGQLVMSAPFLSIPHVVTDLLADRCPRPLAYVVLLPLLRLLVPHAWNNVKALPQAAACKWRISIIHGGQDKLVPVTHGRELYRIAHRAMGTQASFLELPQAGHNDLLNVGFNHYVGLICSTANAE